MNGERDRKRKEKDMIEEKDRKDMVLIDVFFFASRRRHTRYWRDWSSDVCSSDLGRVPPPVEVHDVVGRGQRQPGAAGAQRQQQDPRPGGRLEAGDQGVAFGAAGAARAEERRVREQGRAWGGTHHLKKKNQDANKS